jgi:hypothetical protein
MALGAILQTLSKAADLYNSLSTGNNWHNPSRHVNSCWNCNCDHGVNKCKLPKNQACIKTNKKKWEEEKKKSGSGNGGSGSGEKQYERYKFVNRAGSQKPSGSDVEKFTIVDKCTVARVVDGTVPISLLSSLQIHHLLLPHLASHSSLSPEDCKRAAPRTSSTTSS